MRKHEGFELKPKYQSASHIGLAEIRIGNGHLGGAPKHQPVRISFCEVFRRGFGGEPCLSLPPVTHVVGDNGL